MYALCASDAINTQAFVWTFSCKFALIHSFIHKLRPFTATTTTTTTAAAAAGTTTTTTTTTTVHLPCTHQRLERSHDTY